MSVVFSDMSMSLDGFIAGPNDGIELPLGAGGERLHQWVYELASQPERQGVAGGTTGADDEIGEDSIWRAGAILMGRRMFESRPT